MYRTDNGTWSAASRSYQAPEDRPPLLDLPTYERLIDDGLAAADRRGGPVDHATARRLAIWLAARPQEAVLAQDLARFTDTGAISRAMKTQLRLHARSANYPDHMEAATLLKYCTSRGDKLGPVGYNFARSCDQIDRSDLMLAGLYEQARQGLVPEPAWPETSGPQIIVQADRDSENQTVTLILDAATANAAIFAITAHADEREAHVREVEKFGQSLPEGSYGRRNREAIAAREIRVATRLRAVEHAYRTAIERDSMHAPPEPTRTLRPRDHVTDWQVDLEAES
jgi:hypothetical protein